MTPQKVHNIAKKDQTWSIGQASGDNCDCSIIDTRDVVHICNQLMLSSPSVCCVIALIPGSDCWLLSCTVSTHFSTAMKPNEIHWSHTSDLIYVVSRMQDKGALTR